MEENMPQGEKGLYGLVNNAGVCVWDEFNWQTMCQIKTQVRMIRGMMTTNPPS